MGQPGIPIGIDCYIDTPIKRKFEIWPRETQFQRMGHLDELCVSQCVPKLDAYFDPLGKGGESA